MLGLLAIGSCILAWRLAQGPIDVTALVQREHALFDASGAHLTIGHAALAWEGFAASGRPLDILVENAAASTDDGRLRVDLRRARATLSLPQLLLGRIAPTSVAVDGADITLARNPDGSLPVGGAAIPGNVRPPAQTPRWLTELRGAQVHNSTLTVRSALPGVDISAPHAELSMTRLQNGSLSGSAHLEIVAGAARCTLDIEAAAEAAGTRLTIRSGAVFPPAVAGLSPTLSPLAALDAPVRLVVQASLGPALQPLAGQVDLSAGAGTLHAGSGAVALASIAATLVARPGELRLASFRAVLGPVAGAGTPPPILSASATATRLDGRIHTSFGLDLDGVAMADLGRYWPEGAAKDARAWLTENVTAGRAHDAHISGRTESAADLSDLRLTALAGGLLADDLTVTWLRPVPGLKHLHGRVVLDGPDSLRVTVDRGGQNGLGLLPGSSIRITGLAARHQFADIDARLAGPLPQALELLNHPRLHLLARSGIDLAGAAGDVAARLTLRVPLESRVTMDDITIAATAALAGVHLDRVAAGRTLDGGRLALKLTGDGLSLSGTAAVAGLPTALGLEMDFRDGRADQIVQHVTATGMASTIQLGAAGLPAAVAHLVTGGKAGLRLDYAARRDGRATLQMDADLAQAAVTTPLGWSKPIGPPTGVGGQVMLDHGRTAGVDHLHAEGPGLLVASRAELTGAERTLLLDRVEIGRTRAHGKVVFPAGAKAPLRITLAGGMLDLSPALDTKAAPAPDPKSVATPAPESDAPDKPGQPWTATLAFDQVQLSHGKLLAPLSLDAASDGLHILHADAHAGAPGQLSVLIAPAGGGRTLAIEAADAGQALRALGLADNLAGGHLHLDATFDDTQPGAPLSGTATLEEFNLRSAPAIGRLLQALTLYGVTDLLRGPGLHFSRLVAPFQWRNRVLQLKNARAFSPSLGVTAQGTVDLRRHTADITGTVVPAYFFNQLLGDLPVIGRIFSPEKGGGVFAARYSVRGRLASPKVGVNPLAALTPGFLREGFGLLAPSSPR